MKIGQVNFTIFVMVLRASWRHDRNRAVPCCQILRHQICTIVSLIPVMGFTWIFGLAPIGPGTVLFQYIFTIINPAQGKVETRVDTFQVVDTGNDVNLSHVFLNRRRVLLRRCASKAALWRGDGSVKRLVISKRYHLAYCPVPKIASTFWSNLLLENKLWEEPTSHHDRLADVGANKSTLHLRNLEFDVGYWFLKHYKSILLVRNPYTRLLAAFIDKFYSPNPLYWKLGKLIIRKFRPNAGALSLRCGQNVKFSEFVKYVIFDIKRGNSDQHWKPIYQRCSPCQLEYDIIAKLETISTEGDYIIRRYLPQTTFKDMPRETAMLRLKMNVDNFFRFFPPSVRYCMPFPDALRRLLKKLQVRGMINKDIELPRQWRLLFSVSHADVLAFMREAYQRSSGNMSVLLNRREALVEAFSTVSMDDLRQIRDIYEPDFKLFGYDPEPDYLFKRSTDQVKLFYFS
ncbi:uncharacterized protein LOC135465387 [Liolophura sinensis]|uniref:uncharacterized protein LOC135465387 n=1 Tax=Liolophura sinensis TaxID=3198878 RepID=UPI0031594D62